MSGQPPHGDASTYGNHGCRCQPCRDAWSARAREYKSAHRARRDELRARRALKKQRYQEAQAKAMRDYARRVVGEQ